MRGARRRPSVEQRSRDTVPLPSAPAADSSGRDAAGRFRKGFSGNPRGPLPKDRKLETALRDIADPQLLAKTLWELATVDKDLGAIKYLYDRLCGAPVQRREISIEDVREEARRIAQDFGLAEEDVIREAEAIVRGDR